ncbi:hypothetical protein LCGC14_1181200 [marine sediment metagenome]|uniref:Uncharacterized protein n=1 Tax=marine sediment metagenome TaxID=412755 RepID=A0A0F9PSI8_9ZZZZ
MKKKLVYGIGIANVCLLIFIWFVLTSRLSGIFDFEFTQAISDLILISDQLNLLNAVIIIITILFLFTLEVRKALIIGIIGFSFYLLNEINIMLLTSSYLILRVLVIIFYFSLQIILYYKHFKRNLKEVEIIKDIIYNLRRKFTITKILEITERSKSDKNIVQDTINEMIENKDINADYFKRSKTIVFFR